MRFVKGISLFFVFPLLLLGLGYWAGAATLKFFYPGNFEEQGVTQPGEYNSRIFIEDMPEAGAGGLENGLLQDGADHQAEETAPQFASTANMGETLNVDTEYLLWERDLLRGTVVEITGRLPEKYVGLNREQFLSALEEYELFPPLSEMERGFVGLEVVSFSVEQVVVQMNYEYIQPSESFYLAVQDNEVVVLLEDSKTVFINTGIPLEELPEKVRMQIIEMLWIEDEATLYNFLENYSS